MGAGRRGGGDLVVAFRRREGEIPSSQSETQGWSPEKTAGIANGDRWSREKKAEKGGMKEKRSSTARIPGTTKGRHGTQDESFVGAVKIEKFLSLS